MITEPPRPPALTWGTAALTDFHTPVRFTSSICCQRGSSISSSIAPGVPIPALATTMSSRPSCSTPLSTAFFSASKSRTSTSAVNDPAIERLDEVCRSRRDLRVWRPVHGVPSMCRQISIAMMSAPSSANLTAWLRPCPSAAPVTKATLPSLPVQSLTYSSHLVRTLKSVVSPGISALFRSRCAENRRPGVPLRATSDGPGPRCRSVRGPVLWSAVPRRTGASAPRRRAHRIAGRALPPRRPRPRWACASSASSTSRALMFSPPRMMTSALRSVMVT